MQAMETLRYHAHVRRLSEERRQKFSVAVMGQKSVGKTTIIKQLVKMHRLQSTSSFNSHASQYRGNTIKLGGITLNFAESTSNKNYSETSADISDIINANLFILVFAVDRLSSFNYIESLKDTILETKGDAALVIVGSKHDSANREVGFAYTDCVVSLDWDLPYVEVSSKTGYNLGQILPYLFRYKSIKRFQHLFLDNKNSDNYSRRKSTGCAQEQVFKEHRVRAVSVSDGKAGKYNYSKIVSMVDASSQTERRSSKARKLQLSSLFACTHSDANDSPIVGIRCQVAGEEVLFQSPGRCRKRSMSISTNNKDIFSPLVEQKLVQRRQSMVTYYELARREKTIMQIRAAKKTQSWISAIRAHLKK